MMTNGNSAVDDVFAEIENSLPKVSSVIAEAPPYEPSSAPSPRPSARASTGNGHRTMFDNGPSKTEVKSLEREADKQARATASPLVAKKFGQLAQRVPGANRVRIKKKMDDGTSWFVNDWLFRDIGIDDIEAFVAKFVKPKHGGGHYDIILLDELGREFDAGFVRIMNEPENKNHGDDKLIGVVSDLIQRNQQMMLNMQQPHSPPVDPIDQMRKMKELEKEMGGGGGSNPMLMMMLMQQSQPRGPDPVLMAMMQQMQNQHAELMKKLEGAGSGNSMPMPPPPPPAFDMAGLTAMLSTVAVPLILKLLDNSSAKADANNATKQDVQLMMMELQQRLTQGGEAPNPLEVARETIALFRELHSGEKQQSLQEKLGEMRELRELAKDVVGGDAGGVNRSQTNFYDMAASLLSNKGLGEGVGKMLAVASDRISGGAGAPGPQVTTLSGNGPRLVPARPASALPQNAPQAKQEPIIEVPANYKEFMDAIDTAPNDFARMESVVKALDALRALPQWKDFVQALITAAAQNDRDKAMRGLHRWLSIMVDNRLLSLSAADLTMKAFLDNWAAFHNVVLAKIPPGMIPPPVQEDAPAAKPAVVTPAPAQSAALPEGGEEAEEDEAAPEGPMDVELPPDMEHA